MRSATWSLAAERNRAAAGCSTAGRAPRAGPSTFFTTLSCSLAIGGERPRRIWGKPGLPKRGSGGKVGAAPEGLALRGQEHGERPAALLAEQRQATIVDGVEVGPLLPVDLDVDVELGSWTRRSRGLRSTRGP